MAVQLLTRIGEDVIFDPRYGIHYRMHHVRKTTTEEKLLEDVAAMAKVCAVAEQGKAGKVYRPCLYALQSNLESMTRHVVDRLSENTYLMFFDWSNPSWVPIDADFVIEPWAQIGAHNFISVSKTKVYTNLEPDGLSMRFQTISEAEARAEAFEDMGDEDGDDDPDTTDPAKDVITALAGGLFPMDSKITIKWETVGRRPVPVEIITEPLVDSHGNNQ